MTGDAFAMLLGDFTRAAESGDGAHFASQFTKDPARPKGSRAKIR